MTNLLISLSPAYVYRLGQKKKVCKTIESNFLVWIDLQDNEVLWECIEICSFLLLICSIIRIAGCTTKYDGFLNNWGMFMGWGIWVIRPTDSQQFYGLIFGFSDI